MRRESESSCVCLGVRGVRTIKKSAHKLQLHWCSFDKSLNVQSGIPVAFIGGSSAHAIGTLKIPVSSTEEKLLSAALHVANNVKFRYLEKRNCKKRKRNKYLSEYSRKKSPHQSELHSYLTYFISRRM